MRCLFLCAGFATVIMATGCGGGGSSTIPAVVSAPQVSVAVVPSQATVPIGTFQPFIAIVQGAPASSVTWKTTAGTIDKAGNYTAPASVPPGGTAKITATLNLSPPVSSLATATITTEPVSITIIPSTATVKAGASAVYYAKVGGTTNTSVAWSVSVMPGDSAYPGSIAGGIYTAFSPVLKPDTFAISAVAQADPTKSAAATINVIPLENQEQQAFPISLGTSGVNANSGDCCSGTLGSLLQDQNGKQYILSNNHVIGRVGHAEPGEGIVQPGYVDTLCDFSLPKTVARFTAAAPISSNVDAAIAQVLSGAVNPAGPIIGLGGIKSDGSYLSAPPASTPVAASVGMQVAKSGRTTGLSCGSVLAINGNIDVDIGAECGNPSSMTVRFSGQVVMGSLVEPGDSGSLVVEAATARPVGLIAARSSDGQFSMANPVSDVLTALKTATGLTLSFVGSKQHPVSCAVPSQTSPVVKSTFAAIPVEEITHAVAVQRQRENEIRRDPAVIGVAVGRQGTNPGHAALLVFVEQGKTARYLPQALDGVVVEIIKTGRFRADTVTSGGRKCGMTQAEPFLVIPK